VTSKPSERHAVLDKLAVPSRSADSDRAHEADEASLHELLPQARPPRTPPTGQTQVMTLSDKHMPWGQVCGIPNRLLIWRTMAAAPRKMCAQVDRETELNPEIETPAKAVSSTVCSLAAICSYRDEELQVTLRTATMALS
jgi:hypothetical protein